MLLRALTVSENHDGRNAAHTKLASGQWRFVDVELAHDTLFAQFIGNLIDDRGELLTRTAPCRRKIHEDGLAALEDFLIEIEIIEDLDVFGCHDFWNITPARGSASQYPAIFAFTRVSAPYSPMNREIDDVFEPEPTATTTSDSRSPAALEAPPGPSPLWTAEGVIRALEPFTMGERHVRLKKRLDDRLDSVTVVFDHPHDPHNGSAVLRSCDAFGVQRVHIVRSNERFSASNMIAKGSERWVDFVDHSDPDIAANLLHQAGFTLLVTHPDGHLTPTDLRGLEKVAIVLGNERVGVGPKLTAAADDTVRIPMRGFVESLNVSVTAAILLQAACQGRPGDLSEARRQNVYARWLRKSVPRAEEVLGALTPC